MSKRRYDYPVRPVDYYIPRPLRFHFGGKLSSQEWELLKRFEREMEPEPELYYEEPE